MVNRIVQVGALVALFFGFANAGDTHRQLSAIKVKVGVSNAPALVVRNNHLVLGATAAGGSLTVTWTQVSQLSDGTMQWVITYTNGAGAIIHIRQLTLDAACTKVTDQYGTLVYTTTGPTDALCTTQSALLTRTNTVINNAATAGKLAL